MSNLKKEITDWGPMCTVNYYAQGLLDIEDIVNTINKMIEFRVPPYERSNVKKSCSVSAKPLKHRMAGMILKVRIPCHIITEDTLPESKEPKIE